MLSLKSPKLQYTGSNLEKIQAVINCFCRQSKDLLEEPCKLSDIRETCIPLKDMAQVVIDGGIGRELSREQTLGFLERAEQAVMVLQPENNQNPLFWCGYEHT